MFTQPSRDIVLLCYVQNVWEWGGWCGISLIYPYLYLCCGPVWNNLLMIVWQGSYRLQNESSETWWFAFCMSNKWYDIKSFL